jgi:hypothetical protein
MDFKPAIGTRVQSTGVLRLGTVVAHPKKEKDADKVVVAWDGREQCGCNAQVMVKYRNLEGFYGKE